MFPGRIWNKAATGVSNHSMPVNPFKAKKPWPPDFATLSSRQQLRLERRYKRRSKLKWLRPGWVKGVTLAQWGMITFAVTYGVLFMEWGDEVSTIKQVRVHEAYRSTYIADAIKIRKWFWREVEATKSISSPNAPSSDGQVPSTKSTR